ncbi:hypothetical protein [Butyrivibrio sp. AE3004]|uniref:hypothetical protein n=1 Tax=Butyrivibrio sp. AE3004 TaxID=1506994 RepID=UPI0004944D97|nr:hypothetical protein [Butyrivibrio sp. AE3004]
MKKVFDKGKLLAVFFIAVFAAAIFLIVFMLKMSDELRKFKVDMFVLCNEADICVGNGHDGKYRISEDNLKALNSIMSSTRGKFTLQNPETIDTISFEFKHEGNKWILNISDVGDNRLRVDLTGQRKYKIFISNNKKYDEFVRVVSEKGYISPNKKFGN